MNNNSNLRIRKIIMIQKIIIQEQQHNQLIKKVQTQIHININKLKYKEIKIIIL